MTGGARNGGTLAEDYRALREGAGGRPAARDVLSLRGPDAVEYLQGQCSQDVAGLDVGTAADALLLAPDGKLDALLRVTRTAEDGFVLDVGAGFGPAVAERLRRFKLRSKLEIAVLDWTGVALRGPGTPAPDALAGNWPDALCLAVSWGGWSGVDVLGPGPLDLPGGVRPVGDAAWEACRIESGIPVMGRELDGRTIAAEAGLVERSVSLTKGCFTGQELVARLDARGNRVARRLCAVVLDGVPADVAVLLGATLGAPGSDKALGTVTSAAWCPGVGAPAGLAFAHRSLEVPGPVTLSTGAGGGRSGDGGPVHRAAELRPLPLV